MAAPPAPTGVTISDVPYRGRTVASWTYTGTGAQTGHSFRFRPVGSGTWQGETLTVTGAVTSVNFPPNQAVNGDVENGTTNWESNTSLGAFVPSAFVRTTAVKHAGAGSLEVTLPHRRTSWVNQLVSHHTAGQRYIAEARVLVPDFCQGVGIEAVFKPMGNLRMVFQSDHFTRVMRTYTATSLGTHVGVRAIRPVGGTKIWVDDFKVYATLDPGDWEVQVRTSNADGAGAWSSSVTVTALEPAAYMHVLGGESVPQQLYVRGSSDWVLAQATRKVS